MFWFQKVGEQDLGELAGVRDAPGSPCSDVLGWSLRFSSTSQTRQPWPGPLLSPRSLSPKTCLCTKVQLLGVCWARGMTAQDRSLQHLLPWHLAQVSSSLACPLAPDGGSVLINRVSHANSFFVKVNLAAVQQHERAAPLGGVGGAGLLKTNNTLC